MAAKTRRSAAQQRTIAKKRRKPVYDMMSIIAPTKRGAKAKKRTSPADIMSLIVAPKRAARPKRYRAAKADGSIGTLQRTIEKQMNLPSGSVRIVYPSGRKARSDADVGALRVHWRKYG